MQIYYVYRIDDIIRDKIYLCEVYILYLVPLIQQPTIYGKKLQKASQEFRNVVQIDLSFDYFKSWYTEIVLWKKLKDMLLVIYTLSWKYISNINKTSHTCTLDHDQ